MLAGCKGVTMPSDTYNCKCEGSLHAAAAWHVTTRLQGMASVELCRTGRISQETMSMLPDTDVVCRCLSLSQGFCPTKALSVLSNADHACQCK